MVSLEVKILISSINKGCDVKKWVLAKAHFQKPRDHFFIKDQKTLKKLNIKDFSDHFQDQPLSLIKKSKSRNTPTPLTL